MDTKTRQLRIDRARWQLLSQDQTVFYGALAMSLKDEIDTEPQQDCQTAQTDGKRIRWNPAFLDRLKDEELRFVLAHEILHCAHGHLWRFPAPYTKRANIATDNAINLTLQTIPGMRMPEGGLSDAQWQGMAEEEIFNRLPPDPPKSGQGQGEGSGQGDADSCGGYTTPAEGEPGKDGKPAAGSTKDRWESAVIQAAMAAKAAQMQGSIPADIARRIEKVLAQPIDWRTEMLDFVKQLTPTRNDWTRSARRHAWQKVIYPRHKSDNTATVIFARDTSGSISPEILAQFNALISQALAETQCPAIIMDCDAEIHAEHRIDQGGTPPDLAHGGGGTSFCPVFDRAQELVDAGETIAGIVYLTDMYGDFPETAPEIPVLWVCTTDQKAPFGRTVEVEI